MTPRWEVAQYDRFALQMALEEARQDPWAADAIIASLSGRGYIIAVDAVARDAELEKMEAARESHRESHADRGHAVRRSE